MDAFFIVMLASTALIDIRTRRIPNAITLPLTCLILVFQLYAGGMTGFQSSATGALSGLGIGLACCMVGVCGGGDMKLLMCIGALLGFSGLLDYLPYALVGLGMVSSLYLMKDKLLGVAIVKLSSIPIVGMRTALKHGFVVGTTQPVALPLFVGGVLYVCLNGLM